MNRSLFLSFAGLLIGLLTAEVSCASAQEIDVRAEKSAPIQSGVRLERMLLLLDAGEEKRKALDKLLTAQQTRGDAQFHQWLTPAEFARRFSVSAGDAAMVTNWLRAQGFAVAALPAGRGWVEFSGSVGQVEKAFGSPLFATQRSGAVRYRLMRTLPMPTAIAAHTRGLVSLDGQLAAAAVTAPVASRFSAEAMAAATSLSQAQSLTPSLAAAWLGFNAQRASGGAGEAIAIPARSGVRAEDFAAFRRSFGLPEATLDIRLSGLDASGGPDASEVRGGSADEAAAIEAVSWAGVAAPEARIVLVPVHSSNATDGIDLALAATIDGRLANTVSIGYTACETSLSAAHREFYAAAYRQAAAQGMAVIAASGDSGAAACHASEDTRPVSTGRAVNGLASTPWNTAIGAVAFSEAGKALTGWQPGGSGAAYATGGGVSRIYDTPEWQSAAGVPLSDPGTAAAHHRSLPDLSLPTAGVAFCFSGDIDTHGCRLVTGGGSAASAAIFSGIAALLAEKYGPQGNLAPNLYALRRTDSTEQSTAAFIDVTEGSAKLPCVAGSADCQDSQAGAAVIGFSADLGYDLVSGLGAVNAQTLVANWAKPQVIGTANVSVVMTNIGGLTYNPTATVVLGAKVTSGSGGTVPTGTVQFFDQTTVGNTGTPVTLAADGTASYSESGQFTSGGHNIVAIYSGDSTYKSATSQPVTLNIQPSATTLVVSPSTSAPTAGTSVIVTGTLTALNPGDTPPTGSLTVNLDGIAQGTQRFTTTAGVTTGSVTVTAPSGGNHSLQGTYSGDINYNNSTSLAVTIIVPKAATVTTISATPATLTTGVLETITATVAPATATVGVTPVLTGSVSFYDAGTTLLGTVTVSSNTAVLSGVTLTNTASHTVTAIYSGDTSFLTSTSGPLVLASNLLPVTVTLVASNAVRTPDEPVTLTATVNPVNPPPLTSEQNPSGFVLFYAGNTLISAQIPVLQGLGNTGVASTQVPHLPSGQYVVTARYSGDPTFAPAISNSVNLQVEDFTILSTTSNISIAQGQSANVTFTVSSLGGLTGPIQVKCEEQNPPQNGAIQCAFSPEVVDGSGTSSLAIVTSGGAISQNQPGRSPFAPVAGGGVALALLGALLTPIGRRAGWLRIRQPGGKLLILVLLLAGLVGGSVGCTNTTALITTRGTPLGQHTLKITAAAVVGTVTVSHYAYITVNVTP